MFVCKTEDLHPYECGGWEEGCRYCNAEIEERQLASRRVTKRPSRKVVVKENRLADRFIHRNEKGEKL